MAEHGNPTVRLLVVCH